MRGKMMICALSCLLIGLGSMNAGAQTVLSLDCSEIASGTVYIDLTNTAEVAAVEMTVTFDKTAYTVTTIAKTERTQAIDIFMFNQVATGVKLVATGLGHSIAAGSGHIAKITLSGTGTPDWCIASGSILADALATPIAHTTECCEAPIEGNMLSLDCSDIASGKVYVDLVNDEVVAAVEMTITYDKTMFTVSTIAKTDRTTSMDIFMSNPVADGVKLVITGLGHSIAVGSGHIATINMSGTGTGDWNWCVKAGSIVADPLANPIDHETRCCHVGVVPAPSNTIPTQFALSQNYPNPFNPNTALDLSLPEASRVHAVIYNIMGQQIRTLADSDLPAGYYSLTWDGLNDQGQAVSSGVYFCSVHAGELNTSVKMLLMK